MLRILLIAAALFIASAVIASVGLDALDLAQTGGWWALVFLAFPAFIAWGGWKHGDRY